MTTTSTVGHISSPTSLPSPAFRLFSSGLDNRHGGMGWERTRKLGFVRANLRLQSRDYAKKALIAWDPDSVESDGYMGNGSDVNDDPSDSEDGEESDDAEESENVESKVEN